MFDWWLLDGMPDRVDVLAPSTGRDVYGAASSWTAVSTGVAARVRSATLYERSMRGEVGEALDVMWIATTAAVSTGMVVRYDGEVRPIRGVELYNDGDGHHHTKVMLGVRRGA